MTIPGVPEPASAALLKTICAQPQVQRVVLYGSRALGRQHSGSDVDLCLVAPGMTLAELLELGAVLDDLLLCWRIDLQLDHHISHEGLRAHIQRAGRVLWDRAPLQETPVLGASKHHLQRHPRQAGHALEPRPAFIAIKE